VPTVLFLRKRRRLASAGLDFVDIVCGCGSGVFMGGSRSQR
jgi:hypothetical protein